MPYTPPLIKVPSLRIPAAPPYRPPEPIPFSPTQTAPIYQSPDLLPPTGLDLKGVVCIYSNPSIWEPKKIRYRYPEDAWQEIVGDHYSLTTTESWQSLPSSENYRIFFSANGWCFGTSGEKMSGFLDVTGGFTVSKNPDPNWTFHTPVGYFRGANIRILLGNTLLVSDNNGSRPRHLISNSENGLWVDYESFPCPGEKVCSLISHNAFPKGQACALPNGEGFLVFEPFFMPIHENSFSIDRVVRLSDNQELPPPNQCTFRIFDVFNQEILSITREVCPEVIVVPERCYFQAENERLVARIIQTLLDPPLRIEYEGHCATVWKDGIISLPPYPLQIYKECSDNPNCPPPRIRFDKKCEEKEKCHQCPPGTTIKILNGLSLLCVNSSGCVIKTLKYKPKCHRYDCICS